jgi:PiT family inorganic phosphate transporter
VDGSLIILVLLIVTALAFDFLNGLHDAANSIATIVSTRVLKPHLAVLWAGFFNFIAFAVFGTAVAKTIGSGIVSPDVIDNGVIFGALVGAIVWNIVTWIGGIPSSSSHALVGGLIGAGVAKAGFGAVVIMGVLKAGSGIFMAPALGFAFALLLVLIVSWLFVKVRPNAADSIFRRLQFFSASAYSLGHGGNDAQKTMGIIAALLAAHAGQPGGELHIPFWVVLTCQAAMGLGTLFGGWRIVKTMGSKITKLSPMQGFCAESAGAITLFLATHFGIPESSTHTITGCIIGVGSARRVSAVRWGVARGIVVAWFITIPAAAVVGAGFYWLWRLAGG